MRKDGSNSMRKDGSKSPGRPYVPELMDDAAMQNFFGSTQEHSGNTEHGYILFYARNDSNGGVSGSGGASGGVAGAAGVV